ncbi:acyloxyacyl hydrolase [Wolbachia endosymbiont (group A) of Cydia splendana]|uniref:acyloxyacyl hydrolase n=1 Tax=Wolbachia endosymbiont (group A) of Cydia splendana TaxID=2954000 RepID=UPI0021F89E36|nr:P44/Msp2 family outer membrane protein [Wolbachia endosymbiont (group A) of Cydia splendana]
MHYKKFFSAAALATLLSLSNSAFSDPVGPISDEETSYYVRLQYNGEVLPLFTKVDNMKIKKGTDDVDPFKASFIGGGAAFGYKMDDIRVDIEGLYSQLNKNVNNDEVLTPNTVAGSLTAISGLVNVYYDIAIEDVPITPYVGVGVGAAYISTPLKDAVNDQKSKFGFAGQVKAGVSYDVTPEVKLYAGARYFGSYGANFDKSSGGKDKGGHTVLYSTVGAEAGVAFNF